MIASGGTDRQLRAIGDAIEEAVRQHGIKPMRREGENELRWLLLDFGDFVVHLFVDEARAYYELERLWKDAPPVEWNEDGEPSEDRAGGAGGR